MTEAHSDRGDGLPVWVILELRARTDCYCGRVKGHAGWPRCVTVEIEKAESDAV